MVMVSLALACAITEVVFPSKCGSDFSNNFSLRKQRDWGWVSRSCVQSLNHMAAQLRQKMRMVAARGSSFLFRRAPKLELYDDPSKQPGLRNRRRPIGAKGSYPAASLRRVQE